ncbi:tetratricopeptide repeat protein, partial [Paenibacillus ferrarius]|uniref:tetratricopeptide repeat protein n=1 Tax=Paenibacillus ferrarius TaxID=1469647 RepID=UPI003D2AB14A
HYALAVTEHIIEIYYYQGLVYLHKDDIQKSNEELEKLFEMDRNSYFGFNLLYKIAVHTNNELMYQKAIEGFRSIAIDSTELKLKELFYEIIKSNFTDVINELAELDKIKIEFENREDAYYYLGLSYLQTEQFILAKKHLSKSNEMKPSLYKTYLVTLTEIIPIISKRGAMFLITDIQKEILERSLKTLYGVKDYFSDMPLQLQEEYWGHILNIRLFLRPADIISEIEIMSDTLKQSDMIQLMLAEAYFVVGSADKSEEIYKMLYQKRKNPQLLDKITTTLLLKKDYSGIVELLKVLEYTDYDELGDIAGTYITAFSKLNILPATIEFINSMEKAFPNAPLLFHSAAIIFNESDETKLSSEYMNKTISMIEEDNEALRMFISTSCEKMGFIESAIQVLLPLKNSTKAKEALLRLSLEYNDDSYENDELLALAEQTVEQLIQEGVENINIHNAQAEIAFRNDTPENALKHLIEAFKLSPTINTAYNIVAVKINNNQPDDLQQYIDYLIKSLNPRATMLAASAMDFLGSRGAALEIAYKAFQLLGNEFDESIYLQYSMLFMVSKNLSNDEQVNIEFDKVRIDTVIELVDNSGVKRYICIESNPDLVVNEGEVYLSIEHYTNRAPQSIKLLNVELHQKIELDGIEYFINQIINKYVHVFRVASSTYIQQCPDSPYLQAVEVREDDPITPLIPFLERGKVRHEFLMQQYNFVENSIGLPISALCDGDYFKYPSAMMHLLETKEQVYFAGEILPGDEQSTFVLSLSSVLLLNILKCNDLIEGNKDRFKITKSLLEKIKSLFDEAITTRSRVSGSMGMDKSGRPVFTNITETDKNNTVEFWRRLYLTLSKLETINEIENYSFNLRATKFIGNFDIEAIVATNQINGVFVSDDLFLHKVARFMYDSISYSNSVTILNHFLSTEELLEKLHTLSQFKYHFCVTYEILLKIINDSIIDKPIIYGAGTSHDKVKHIIRNILSHRQLYTDNLLMLRAIIYTLYENRINKKAEELINLIIREVVLSSRFYRISSLELLEFFLEPAGIDLVKAEYLIGIFRKY